MQSFVSLDGEVCAGGGGGEPLSKRSYYIEANVNLQFLCAAMFADVMLPYYRIHHAYSLFFIFFLVAVLYIGMNLVLGSVYSVYKQNLVVEASKVRQKGGTLLLWSRCRWWLVAPGSGALTPPSMWVRR